MKVRNGFISNSSSTSFCIVGMYFNKSELESFKIKIEDLEDFGFDTHPNQSYDGYYVGIFASRWAKFDIKYSELIEKLKDMYMKCGIDIKNENPSVCTDGWYDG